MYFLHPDLQAPDKVCYSNEFHLNCTILFLPSEALESHGIRIYAERDAVALLLLHDELMKFFCKKYTRETLQGLYNFISFWLEKLARPNYEVSLETMMNL